MQVLMDKRFILFKHRRFPSPVTACSACYWTSEELPASWRHGCLNSMNLLDDPWAGFRAGAGGVIWWSGAETPEEPGEF
jgi:hypothetical protein